MKRRDGGPAFAGGESYYTTDLSGCRTDHKKAPLHEGMSLRDWFAGQALVGLAHVDDPDAAAHSAYAHANAMLAERARPVAAASESE